MIFDENILFSLGFLRLEDVGEGEFPLVASIYILSLFIINILLNSKHKRLARIITITSCFIYIASLISSYTIVITSEGVDGVIYISLMFLVYIQYIFVYLSILFFVFRKIYGFIKNLVLYINNNKY